MTQKEREAQEKIIAERLAAREHVRKRKRLLTHFSLSREEDAIVDVLVKRGLATNRSVMVARIIQEEAMRWRLTREEIDEAAALRAHRSQTYRVRV